MEKYQDLSIDPSVWFTTILILDLFGDIRDFVLVLLLESLFQSLFFVTRVISLFEVFFVDIELHVDGLHR